MFLQQGAEGWVNEGRRGQARSGSPLQKRRRWGGGCRSFRKRAIKRPSRFSIRCDFGGTSWAPFREALQARGRRQNAKSGQAKRKRATKTTSAPDHRCAKTCSWFSEVEFHVPGVSKSVQEFVQASSPTLVQQLRPQLLTRSPGQAEASCTETHGHGRDSKSPKQKARIR